MGDVRDATEAAIAAATHLTDMDKGAIEALRSLADKIDAWDVIVDWASDDVAGHQGERPKVPTNDNVSIPTYLKFCESLGLTPTGRTRAQIEKGKGDGGSSTLGKLRLAHGGKGA
jgi:hypothetical protein